VFQAPNASKVEQVKAFTVNAFKVSKQLFNEIIGEGARTVDPTLDSKLILISRVMLCVRARTQACACVWDQW